MVALGDSMLERPCTILLLFVARALSVNHASNAGVEAAARIAHRLATIAWLLWCFAAINRTAMVRAYSEK